MSRSATITRPSYCSRPWRAWRSAGAVLAGLLANIVIVGAIDAALRAAGIYPAMFQPMAEHLWALALSYRVAVAVFGGFLTALIAPARPMRHVMVLGGIATVLSVLFVLANWNKPEFGPHWFAVSAATTSLPLAVLGGMLAAKRFARVNQ